MKIFVLSNHQKLPISKEEAWSFLSSPKNLARITPKSMEFKVISGADRPIYAGQIIEYSVTPLLGIRMKWVTEISHVKEGSYFVDEQRYGPYALWHHKHFIKEIEGGVEMEDLIHYKLPFGILGAMLQPILVKSKLKEVFDYRTKKLTEIFGEYEPS